MTSNAVPGEAYVWIWLPGQTAPVVAGRIVREGARYVFNYGRSYLNREGAIPIYDPELPLLRGAIVPQEGLAMAGCLRDAAPDAWGRRVIMNRLTGGKGGSIDVSTVDELFFLLFSGSDRVGALDFQASATDYNPRSSTSATLAELLDVAALVEKGIPITPDLEQAVFHGTSLGGARPKAAIETQDAKYIAKFSSSNDITNVLKAEYVAMRLAAKAGLDVAEVALRHAAGKDVLLVKRFDREKVPQGWARKSMVSALTILGLDEMMGRYASYQDLAEIVRTRFTQPKPTLREIYGRLIFNILCSNTDDHARNHAAFWNGSRLSLTPAYDICPQNRSGREANQAMFIVGDRRSSTLATCLEAAPQFLLSKKAATDIIKAQLATLRTEWEATCDEAELPKVERQNLWGRQFLNPFAFESAPEDLA